MSSDPDYTDAERLFAARPWIGADAALPEAARAVPTMLATEETQLYYWLARHWAKGAGVIVDLGSFIGGSTARLAAGQADAGRALPVFAYDNFTASEELKAKLLYPAGIPPFAGNDILLEAHRLLTPWKPAITFRQGDILEQGWHGEPIELLAIDAAKSAALTDHIAAEFFPALIPGRSIVIHQDFLHRVQPWLPAQMTRLRRYFKPLSRVARDCVVFLCTEVPSPEALRDARVSELSDRDLARLVRTAASRYSRMAGRYYFASMVRKINANPEERIAWRMWRN
jgi:hypothetical protein